MKNVDVIDCGKLGLGCEDVASNSFEKQFVRRSGSACMDGSANRVKMIVNIYPCSSETFISHHGRHGASVYLKNCFEGIENQKRIAAELGIDVFSNGSLYVCRKNQVEELRNEFDLLKSLDCDEIEFLNEKQTCELVGTSEFSAAIYFKTDAIIDSSQITFNALK